MLCFFRRSGLRSLIAGLGFLLGCFFGYSQSRSYPQDPQDFFDKSLVVGFTVLPPQPFPVNQNRETVPASEARFGNQDLVIGVVGEGESRAYPLNFLVGPTNEIVNDRLGGLDIAVTWSLANKSGLVYSRSLEGMELEFGVRGLVDGTLLMYDRQTLSLWRQLTGTAIDGPLKDRRLEKIPCLLTTWEHWKSAHPETTAYINPSISHFGGLTSYTISDLVSGTPEPIQPEDLILGVTVNGDQKAYPLWPDLGGDIVINDRLGDSPVLVFVASDYSVLAAAVRRAGNRILTFALDEDDHLVDEQTNSIWDPVTLRCLSGRLEGQTLSPVTATTSLWNGWIKAFPETSLFSR
jgi:hypothetical protein